jgi:hypothetical protein
VEVEEEEEEEESESDSDEEVLLTPTSSTSGDVFEEYDSWDEEDDEDGESDGGAAAGWVSAGPLMGHVDSLELLVERWNNAVVEEDEEEEGDDENWEAVRDGEAEDETEVEESFGEPLSRAATPERDEAETRDGRIERAVVDENPSASTQRFVSSLPLTFSSSRNTEHLRPSF